MGFIRDEIVKPILIGGIICGVLSSVPVIACLNSVAASFTFYLVL